MPLPKPTLDNRTFDQLVSEGRGLIPRVAPQWTDQNASDPGITLIEMLAYLVEQDSYRLDQTTDSAYRAFLRLVGIDVLPAQVADAVVVLKQEAVGSEVPLPAGIQIADITSAFVFNTAHAVNVSSATIAKVLCGSSSSFIDSTQPNVDPGVMYQPFGASPQKDSALYIGFDRALATNPIEMSLYVWTPAPGADRETRKRLIAEWEAIKAETAKNCPPGVVPEIPDWKQHYSVRTIWEYHRADDTWAPLADVVDETRALTLSGPIRFIAPSDHAAGGPDFSLFFIRCRILSGEFECAPSIDNLAINAVPASHAAEIEAEEVLGTSAAYAMESYTTQSVPVVHGSVALRILVSGSPDGSWEERPNFDLSGPHNRHFVLDGENGIISFGDGRQGRVPPADGEVRAFYQVGGGPAGNVTSGTLVKLLNNSHNTNLVPGWAAISPSLSCNQPFVALGGAVAEDMTEAKARAVAELERRTRAVTLQDFEAIALETPGVPVARVKALADYYPNLPCWDAPGAVTVIVIPDCPGPKPTASPDMLRAVYEYINRRRTLTTDLYTIPACFTTVIVSATLLVEDGTDITATARTARTILDNFFDPLHGGPDGGGWPIGRDVYRAEVMALLASIPGVISVTNVGLQADADNPARCEYMPICPDCLPASGDHRIEVVGTPAVPVIERKPQNECA